MSTTTQLRSLLWVPVLIFCILYLLAMFFKWRTIESDITFRVNDTLSVAGYSWVGVSLQNRGREVLLTGEAPTEMDIRQVKKLARTVYGVRSVTGDFSLSDPVVQVIQHPNVHAVKAPTLLMSLKDNQLYLSGELGSQSQQDKVLAQAIALYGIDHVVHNLSVVKGVAAFDSTDTLLALLNNFDSDGEISIRANTIEIVGEVASENRRQYIVNSIKKAVPVDYNIESLLLTTLVKESPLANDNKPVVAEIPKDKINKYQCGRVLNAFLKERSIYFDYNKAAIAQASYTLLNDLAKVAGQCPEALFEVSGHTDTTGNKASNKWLSEARAKAVVEYLSEVGVEHTRLVAIGYGEDKPIASNVTPEGRAKNRRIEFTVK